MKNYILLTIKSLPQSILKSFFGIVMICCVSSPVHAADHDIWVTWDSPEGIARFNSSDTKENFWKLVRFYESQFRPSYCGIASAVIALNALSINAPDSRYFDKYNLFNQEEILTEQQSLIDPVIVRARGITLVELNDFIKQFSANVTIYKAIKLSDEEIRDIIISTLKNSHQIVLALYQRREVNQYGGGHWSPVAAYDKSSDSFLLLDVARFKYPPVWIDAKSFIRAMKTVNNHGESRGFLIVEKGIE